MHQTFRQMSEHMMFEAETLYNNMKNVYLLNSYFFVFCSFCFIYVWFIYLFLCFSPKVCFSKVDLVLVDQCIQYAF